MIAFYNFANLLPEVFWMGSLPVNLAAIITFQKHFEIKKNKFRNRILYLCLVKNSCKSAITFYTSTEQIKLF